LKYLLKKYSDIVATDPYLQRKTGTETVINGVEYNGNYDYDRIIISRKLHAQKFLREIGFSIVGNI